MTLGRRFISLLGFKMVEKPRSQPLLTFKRRARIVHGYNQRLVWQNVEQGGWIYFEGTGLVSFAKNPPDIIFLILRSG